MGYTHYWNINPIKGKAKDLETKYQRAIEQCNTVIKAYNHALKRVDAKHPDRLSGFSAHTDTYAYGGLNVNGTKDLGHETFTIREHYSQNESDFCKTARKPYDIVVVACLIILKHYLGDAFMVDSDGDASDWVDGLELAKSVLKLDLNIPASIRRELKGVS